MTEILLMKEFLMIAVATVETIHVVTDKYPVFIF